MRILAGLILLAAVVLGQPVEATVFLPESLCGLGWIEYMVWNPANNQVYAANWHAGNVIAISAGSGKKTARVPVGDYGGVLCASADLNKVYAYDETRQTLAVIDGNTNTVAREIYVPLEWAGDFFMAYSPVGQKLYCLSPSGQLAVLDAVSDSITVCRRAYEQYYECGGPLYLAAADKFYIPLAEPWYDGIVVVDGATDTAVATIRVDVDGLAGMVANDSSNKVYFQEFAYIAVVSGAANTLRAMVLVEPPGTAAGICCNPVTNRVYAAYQCVEPSREPGVVVVDGDADTIITTVTLSSGPVSITCSPASNRVYVGLADDSVAVIDCASNQVVATIHVGHDPSIACYAAANDAVFMSLGGADLAEIDCPSNSTVHVEDLGCQPGAIAYADEQDRLYVLDRYGGFLVILDGATYEVRRSESLPSRPINQYSFSSLAYSRDLGRMYVTMGDSGLAVFDCATDSLRGVINVSARAIFYDSVRRKLYCAGSSSLLVLDAEAETLLTEIPNVAEACAFCLNPVRGLLYVGGYGPYSVSVIDCTGDTIVRVLETNLDCPRLAGHFLKRHWPVSRSRSG
jgi:YVTN family beta-propeller protein